MITVNCEADELLMYVCTSVTERDYYITFKNGGRHKLGSQYYTKGRFDHYKTIDMLSRIGKVKNVDYIVECIPICNDFNAAVYRFKRLLRKIEMNVGKYVYSSTITTKGIISAEDLHTYLQLWLGPTDRSNFRYKSAVRQPYKAGRPDKPEIYEELRQYIINVYGAQVIIGYEGDDALGIHKGIMVHRDKDINMIPGIHFNYVTNTFQYIDDFGGLSLEGKDKDKILKGTGKMFFYAQLLMGDRTDNIPSVPHPRYKGYGAKTTYELLRHCDTEIEAFNTVSTIYRQTWPYEWLERLKEQADLVWICREYGKYGRDYIDFMLGIADA